MFLAQRSLIYPAAVIAPQLADQALPALRAIETEPEPGLRLTRWSHPPAGEREPLIVFFHGTGSALAHPSVKLRTFIAASRSRPAPGQIGRASAREEGGESGEV